MTKRNLSRRVSKVTEGVFACGIDMALWLTVFFLNAASPQSKTGALSRSEYEANKFLEEWNYYTLKNAIASARRIGLIRRSGRGRRTKPEITMDGTKRLNAILPTYDKYRPWDGRLYLLTFDIPEERKKDREFIRSIAKRLGMGMLQKSVWITPYDPREKLRELVKKNNLSGSIIIADIGKDGSIGDEDIENLLVRVYNLEVINDRYIEFISECESTKMNPLKLYFTYYSILQDDPQLPFKLLPDWWKGDKAYELFYRKIAKKINPPVPKKT